MSYARDRFGAVSALYNRLELVRVLAGEFVMGTRTEEIAGLLKAYGGEQAWYEWEAPQHRLALPEYAIGKAPVTVSQFEMFVKATGYRLPMGWYKPATKESATLPAILGQIG